MATTDLQRRAWIDVRDRGAVGDGETDDTAALVALADALGDGDTVFFPKGEYVVSRPSGRAAVFAMENLVDVRLVGEPGAKISVEHDFSDDESFWFLYAEGCRTIIDGLDVDISITDTPTVFPIRGAFAYSVKSDTNPHRGLTVKNCRLRVNHPDGGDIPVDGDSSHDAKIAVCFVEADDGDDPAEGLVFVNNYVHDSPGRTIWAWNVTDILVHGNTFDECADDYPIIRAQVFSGRNIRVTSNLLRKMEGSGPIIEIDGKVTRGARDVVISGNNLVCQGGHIGINLVDVEDGAVQGNVIVTASGVTVASSSSGFAGIRIRNSQVASPDASQQVATGNIAITGNIIRGRPAGISIEAEGPTMVVGNSIIGCNGVGVEIQGGYYTLSGNHIADNGSHGVLLSPAADDINGDPWPVEGAITGNMILSNGGDGVSRLTTANDIGPTTITGNQIRHNGGYGIRRRNEMVIVGNHLQDNTSGSFEGTAGIDSTNYTD